ncbi:hypothetical protein Tco_0514529 [Tanacetum coccineum]
MSHSTISIPSNSVRESIRSSPSVVILIDSEAEVMPIHIALPEIALEAAAAAVVSLPTATLDLAIESYLEVKPSEALPSKAPPSPDYVRSSLILAPALPDYNSIFPYPESEPMKDESEPIEDTPKAVDVLSCRMSVRPQPSLLLDYRAAIARWSAAPSSTPYPSHTLKDSASLSGSPLAAPSVPCFGPSRRRSRPISSSSSSGTSPAPFGSLPRRRHLISSYSTPSASVGPSCKRCWSPTTSRPTAASASMILPSVPADRLPPHKRLRGSPVVSYQDVTIKATTEPIPLPMIEEIEEKLRTPRARVVSLEGENTSLRARVRVAELSDDSTRVMLQTARTRLAEVRR